MTSVTVASQDLPLLVREQGIAAVPHGFGSTFRDWAAEENDHPREVIEVALGACGRKPGQGGLCPLRPVRTPARPDGRLCALPGPGDRLPAPSQKETGADPAGLTGGQYRQSWNRRRKQPRGGLGRSGMDRRFPPLGVKAVASYLCATEKGGWLIRWRIRWRTLLTTPTLLSQRAEPSPSWSRLCPGIRTGSELARIPRILCGKASCGAGLSCPRLARRGVAPHRRGRKWRERPPAFWRWCATGEG